MISATIIGGSQSVRYWLAIMNDGTGFSTFANCGVGTSGAVFESHTTATWHFYKLDQNANSTIWKKTYPTATAASAALSTICDTSDNTYATGNIGGAVYGCVTVKYDSAGALVWQRRINGTGNTIGYGVATDPSLNVYVAGLTTNTDQDAIALKYNSSGTLQWQRQLGGTGANSWRGCDVDSSGNVYVAGVNSSVGNFAKYNTSGTIQFQQQMSGTTQFYSIKVDSSGNLYLVGIASSTANLITKLSGTPTITWQRTLTGSSGFVLYDVAFDDDGNVYVSGQTRSLIPAGGFLAKYDSSGTLQWQRTLTQTNDVRFVKLNVYQNTIYVSGFSNNGTNNCPFAAKFPTDGSATGTYTLAGLSYTYAAGSATGATPTNTLSATTLTDSAGALTEASIALTAADSTFNYTTVPMA